MLAKIMVMDMVTRVGVAYIGALVLLGLASLLIG